MKNNNPGISVILPNYNGRTLLQQNLPGLYEALNYSSLPYEIIVVDDCSNDDSVAFIKQEYPDIIVLTHDVNRGFSATCNTGIYESRLNLLCVTNTDVTFTRDYFANALPVFDDPSIFAVKGDIINYRDNFNNVIIIEKTSTLYYRHGFLRFNKSIKESEAPPAGKLLNNQYVLLGCCFICDRKKMIQLEGFDEIYSPFYWEDADLALRAVEHGYSLAYQPECKVYHHTSSTINAFRKKSLRQLISSRNKFIFTWRHLDMRRMWLSHIPVTGLNLLSRWLILDWKYYHAFFSAMHSQLCPPDMPLRDQSNNLQT